jgi:hypothetical protein
MAEQDSGTGGGGADSMGDVRPGTEPVDAQSKHMEVDADPPGTQHACEDPRDTRPPSTLIRALPVAVGTDKVKKIIRRLVGELADFKAANTHNIAVARKTEADASEALRLTKQVGKCVPTAPWTAMKI